MIGLFGGSFDPFHKAHRAILESALNQLDLDRLIVMPVGRAPHKDRQISFATFRYEMARLGTEGLGNLVVSDDEIREAGIDYTYDTVIRLKALFPEDPFMLIAGSDVLLTIDSWYRPADLLKEVSLAVALRGGDDAEVIREKARAVQETYDTRVTLFDMAPMTLSASQVRDSWEAGDSIGFMCPPRVESFLHHYKIYDFQDSFRPLGKEGWQALLDLEEKTWERQTQARRLHAASVAQYAARLAAVYGLDPGLAARAGLLHDLAKGLTLEAQRALAQDYFKAIGHDQNPLALCMTPPILHGPASAMLAMELTGEGPGPLSEAIAFHSTASPHMSVLGEVLFLADKIAYDRTFSRLEPIRALAEGGQRVQAMALCLEEVFLALERAGESPCPLSLEAYQKYESSSGRPTGML